MKKIIIASLLLNVMSISASSYILNIDKTNYKDSIVVK